MNSEIKNINSKVVVNNILHRGVNNSVNNSVNSIEGSVNSNHLSNIQGVRPKHQSVITCSCWNVAGWYHKDNKVREMIIANTECDVVAVVETHLRLDEGIEIPNFIWIGNNRKSNSNKAKKGFGGVGFLISHKILDKFNVSVINNNFEDVLWISLTSFKSKQTFIFCVCYLPPINSRGDNSFQFF